MAEAILLDKKKILPCSALLQGEYGLNGIFFGVPVKLGAGGVEDILEIELNADERAALEHSAQSVKELIDELELKG
jgi:malate dehydrogenase